MKPIITASFAKDLAQRLHPHVRLDLHPQRHKMIDEYIVDNEEYVGVGSGVFSYLDGKLYASTFSLNEYDKKVASGQMGITGMQLFSRRQQMRYRMMMDLFGLHFDRDAFKQRFGVKPANRGLWLEMLFLTCWASFNKSDRDKPSPVGRYLSLVIMREFFTGVNRLRDIARNALSPVDRGECYVTVNQMKSVRKRSSKSHSE